MSKKPSASNDIACPLCKKPNTWQANNKYRPFCSERCKLIDLGDWAAEKNRLPGDPSNNSPTEDD